MWLSTDQGADVSRRSGGAAAGGVPQRGRRAVIRDGRTAAVALARAPPYEACRGRGRAYALVIERYGQAAAMGLSLLVSAAVLAAAVMLQVRFGARRV